MALAAVARQMFADILPLIPVHGPFPAPASRALAQVCRALRRGTPRYRSHSRERRTRLRPIILEIGARLELMRRYDREVGPLLMSYDAIFEIGGGWGSFSRLLRNAGFETCTWSMICRTALSFQKLYLSLLSWRRCPAPCLTSAWPW